MVPNNPGIINPKAGYPEWFRQAIREEWKTGNWTRQELSAEAGIALHTLYNWVGAENPKRHQQARYDRNIDKVREMHWEGQTYHYIAKITGIPVQTVWDWINKPDKYKR